MGYFIKDKAIAKETISPARVSLSNNPNFIQFECEKYKPIYTELRVNMNLKPDENGEYPLDVGLVRIQIGDTTVLFPGIPERLGNVENNEQFAINFDDKIETAKNLFECIKSHSLLKSHIKAFINSNIITIIPNNSSKDIYYPIETYVGYAGEGIYEEDFIQVVDSRTDQVDGLSESIDMKLDIIGKGFKGGNNITEFTIKEYKTGVEHTFKGTTVLKEIDDMTFYLGGIDNTGNPALSISEITNNLKECLIDNSFFKSNFDISIPFINANGNMEQGTSIVIQSKGSGEEYSFYIEPKDASLSDVFFKISGGNPSISMSSDAISIGHKETEIQLDIYKNTGIFLGESNLNHLNTGSYVTTLSKAYFEAPIWFDINTIQDRKYTTPSLYYSDWWNTGTIQDLRFTAKRLINSDKYYTNDVFYYSSIFYTITGYDRNLEINDMSSYIYDVMKNNKIKPLTHQPVLNYVAKQSQYFNFILSDPNHKTNTSILSLQYELQTQSGKLIAKEIAHEQIASKFHIVNTIKLDIDKWLAKYNQVGIVKVRLCYDGKIVSEPLTYNILPSHLYRVNDYAFLNSLGGWSSFNFGDAKQIEFKTSANIYNSNQTPASIRSSSLETVMNKTAEEKFTVQTMPVSTQIADWLKEMSSSIAVYELSTNRYIVVDELIIKHTNKDSLLRIEMKYHYSDSYNAELK